MAPGKETVSGSLRGMVRTLSIFEETEVVVSGSPEAVRHINRAKAHLRAAAEAVEEADEEALWGPEDKWAGRNGSTDD